MCYINKMTWLVTCSEPKKEVVRSSTLHHKTGWICGLKTMTCSWDLLLFAGEPCYFRMRNEVGLNCSIWTALKTQRPVGPLLDATLKSMFLNVVWVNELEWLAQVCLCICTPCTLGGVCFHVWPTHACHVQQQQVCVFMWKADEQVFCAQTYSRATTM